MSLTKALRRLWQLLLQLLLSPSSSRSSPLPPWLPSPTQSLRLPPQLSQQDLLQVLQPQLRTLAVLAQSPLHQDQPPFKLPELLPQLQEALDRSPQPMEAVRQLTILHQQRNLLLLSSPPCQPSTWLFRTQSTLSLLLHQPQLLRFNRPRLLQWLNPALSARRSK